MLLMLTWEIHDPVGVIVTRGIACNDCHGKVRSYLKYLLKFTQIRPAGSIFCCYYRTQWSYTSIFHKIKVTWLSQLQQLYLGVGNSLNGKLTDLYFLICFLVVHVLYWWYNYVVLVHPSDFTTSHPMDHWASLNTLRPRQYGRHFVDDICKSIFMNESSISSSYSTFIAICSQGCS